MGRTGDDQQLVRHDGLHHQCRLIDPAFDETDLRQTVQHCLRDSLGIADIEPDGHAGIKLFELHQDRRQPVACNGLAGADGDFTARQPTHFRKNQFRIAHTRQGRLCFAQKYPAAFGQLDVAADTMEQLDIIKGLEILDGRADGGSCQTDGFGGPRQMLPFGDGDEDAELFKGHDASFDFIE